MAEPYSPWKTIRSRIIHKNKWITLYEDAVIKPDGTPGTYTYTQSPPFVLIIGIDAEHFVLVRQYRYPLKQFMLEFPGGAIDSGEPPLDAAKREFQEETGLIAHTWTQLGMIYNPNLATVYLAEGLIDTGRHTMHEDGITEVLRVTWADIDRMIATGEFTDSKTLACLLLYERTHTAAKP